MLVAAANVRGDGLSVAPGVLLESHSARLLAQPTWLWDARAATLLLVVRPTAAAAPADGTAPLAPAAVDCAAYPAGRVIFWFAEREVQPGEVLAAQPMYVRAPHDFQPVPPPCVDGWGLSPGAPALLDPASGIGAVAQDAPDGATFNLMAQVGAQTVQGQVRVVDPARHPLKGVWRQVGEIACGGSAQRVPARPLRELRFTGSNIFTATWTPFESYVDYSGTFSFDVPGKDLVLSITGGNDVPAQTQARLRATFDSEGALIVSALPGGTRNPRDPAVCEMVFERR
jgi:hypothetical protein